MGIKARARAHITFRPKINIAENSSEINVDGLPVNGALANQSENRQEQNIAEQGEGPQHIELQQGDIVDVRVNG